LEDGLLRKALIFLAALGILDALYLTWIKVSAQGVCIIGGGCEIVNTSQYSSIAGIPIAVLGLGAYLTMLGILLLEPRNSFFELNGPMLILGISLAGVLYSAYLTYLELYVIHAICEFCLLSAIILVTMLILSILRLRTSLQEA
jgi:uncharacterized membrane protein